MEGSFVICCCWFPPVAFVALLLAGLGCLISAERQGGKRSLKIAGWVCLAAAAAIVVVPLCMIGWSGVQTIFAKK